MARTIGVLIFPQFQLLDAAGPITVFEAAGRETAPPTYRLRVMARTAGPVVSSSSVQLVAEPFVGEALDTLLVVGGWGTREAYACAETLAYVRAAAARARRTASVCSGAFILAAAGLLDGKRATTHWGRAADLARLYPRVRVEPDRIFVRDGAVWTSAGITAGIDLALALVAEDLGEAVAKRAAQQLVVYHRRPGGQSQFSALLETHRPHSRFSPVLAWARERLNERLSVERLAERAAMSPRHFARAFAADTGITPAKAIERLRLEVAREEVESGAAPIERVAAHAGFGDPERMRRAFLRAFGQPPQALRRAAKGEQIVSLR
ncbi:MAG TPA: GlxA family transcriptional regulator [Xanthobacteraceae bacterium]|jgi:transcriptional regulator GlxA family with amidase domain|nr:GlxA family transcriptional regulator [Xanthobacteraceae bacterium]